MAANSIIDEVYVSRTGSYFDDVISHIVNDIGIPSDAIAYVTGGPFLMHITTKIGSMYLVLDKHKHEITVCLRFGDDNLKPEDVTADLVDPKSLDKLYLTCRKMFSKMVVAVKEWQASKRSSKRVKLIHMDINEINQWYDSCR